jgi:hypothetical protein
MFQPLALREVGEAFENEPWPLAATASMLAITGVGMSIYGPKTQYRSGTPEEREEQIEKDLRNMTWEDPEQPAYAEFLTTEQLEVFSKQWQNKRGLVIHNAAYTGDSEEELKSRDANREYLQEMGVSHNEAQQMLIDYYHIRYGYLTDGYAARRNELAKLYGADPGAWRDSPQFETWVRARRPMWQKWAAEARK